MNTDKLIETLRATAGRCQFVGVDYRSKGRGELARYVLRVGVNYPELCARDITELEIQAQTATGIRLTVIKGLIESLKESIEAKAEGRAHIADTKGGRYEAVCNGVKRFEDGTLELQGCLHSYTVLEPGKPKLPVKHRTEETATRAELRAGLGVSKWTTLCLDAGTIQTARLQGEVLVFEGGQQ